MKLLLDTQVWLWMHSAPERFSRRTLNSLANQDNQLFLSAVSVWEIVAKHALGKLQLPEPPATYVPSRLQMAATTPVDVRMPHALQLSTLPGHHRDPFDRLLIAQAQVEELAIVTADPLFRRYDVKIVDAV